MNPENELRDAERRLQAAQLAGDADALDGLLDDRLVAVGPAGTRFGKADDLAAHRSGALRVTRMDEESLDVLVDGALGVTRAVFSAAALVDGAEEAGRLVYTRTWVRRDGTWRVLAAQIGVVAG
jgi:hypothetical protein